jgi:hypothetical protein
MGKPSPYQFGVSIHRTVDGRTYRVGAGLALPVSYLNAEDAPQQTSQLTVSPERGAMAAAPNPTEARTGGFRAPLSTLEHL